MGTLVRGFWATRLAGIDLPRRDVASWPYEAYVPHRLASQAFVLTGEVAADVADATAAVARLDTRASALTNTEALTRLLLLGESVGSSHIEGLEVSPLRLLRADFDRAAGAPGRDTIALEVLANVDAMTYAVEHARERFTPAGICAVHSRLLEPTHARMHAGVLRTEQNWIGGSEYNPLNAAFIPPPPEYVPELLEDLCDFCNADNLPAIAQAAIAHAQFETIHPFADGNGRTGRALIHKILQRRGLARITAPISLVLATCSKEYIFRLAATRVVGEPTSPAGDEGLDRWIGFFATAMTRAVADAEGFEKTIAELQAAWLKRLVASRSHSAARALIVRLPETPLITVQSAAAMLERSIPAANQAVSKLVDAGILWPTSDRGRNRVFEAREVIDAFAVLESRLASPRGDTQIAPPARRAPGRPRRRSSTNE